MPEDLGEYEKNPCTENKLDMIAGAMGYARQLQLHTEKEDNVVYPFALRALPEDVMEEIDRQTLEFEKDQEKAGIQEKYKNILTGMEKKYLRSR